MKTEVYSTICTTESIEGIVSKTLEEFDKNDNLIHVIRPNGYEQWYDYDENGNEIHYKNSAGFEYWIEYDENGNMAHYINNNNFEHWSEYDERANKIYSKDSNGFEEWYEYDENNNKIHSKNSKEFEEWYEYDENNNKIHYTNSDGFEEFYTYDEKGNIIYSKNSNDVEAWHEYEYDENGNITHYINSENIEEWYEYDEKDRLIHYNNNDGDERWYEYNYSNESTNTNHNAKIISAFPACGKTSYMKKMIDSGMIILDSDSSTFHWIKDTNSNKVLNPEWPTNYINHINENIDKADIIFVSSHKEIRKLLAENNIYFTIVVPVNNDSCKAEWVGRMYLRGNDSKFIDMIIENWDKWLKEIDNECTYSDIIYLNENEYIEDIL